MADTKPADTKAADAKSEAKKVMARVLASGAYGKINDVVEVTEDEVKNSGGELDSDASAVAYAKSLAKA